MYIHRFALLGLFIKTTFSKVPLLAFVGYSTRNITFMKQYRAPQRPASESEAMNLHLCMLECLRRAAGRPLRPRLWAARERNRRQGHGKKIQVYNDRILSMNRSLIW